MRKIDCMIYMYYPSINWMQMIKESSDHPEQGQTDYAVTAARAMELRADAVLLLLWGAVEALMAMHGGRRGERPWRHRPHGGHEPGDGAELH
jgi:hypothetical protein